MGALLNDNHSFLWVPWSIFHSSFIHSLLNFCKILANELDELQMSTSELARILHVPTNRITEIINGQRGITADTALRLGRWFGTGAELWINLQKNYELRLAEQKKGEEIEATISPRILLSEDKQVTVLC